MAKTIDLPNGDRATIHPYNAQKARESLKALAKDHIRISLGDGDLLNSIEFQIASGKAVIKEYEVKTGENEYKTLTPFERFKLIEERPKITNWLFKKAQEMATIEDAEFDEDSKNS